MSPSHGRRQHGHGLTTQRKLQQAGIRTGAFNQVEISAAPEHRRLQAFCGLQYGCGRVHLGANNRRTWTNDAGFLSGYGSQVRAKKLLVIQADGCNDRTIGIDEIHRIQPTAQTHLQDSAIQF